MATTQNTEYQGGNEVNFGNVYQGVINTMYKNQARIDAERKQEQARAQEALKGMQSSFAKVNPNGLQQVDLKDWQQMYGKLQESYAKVISSKFNPTDTMEYEKIKGELLNLTSLSKERGARDFSANQTLGSNIEKYKENEVKAYRDKRDATPTLQLTDINPDYTPFRIMYDSSKFDSDLEKSVKTIMDSGEVKPLFESSTTRLGGRNYAIDTTRKQELTKEMALNSLDQLYRGNSNAKRTIDELYGGDLNRAYEAYKPKFSTTKTDRDIKADPIIRVNVNAGNGTPDYRDIGDSDVIFNNGKSTFKAKNQVDFNEGKVTLTGSSGMFNADTGQPYNLTGATQGELMSVMNVPVGKVTSGGGKYSRQGILTPNYTKDSNYKQMGLVKITYKDEVNEVVTDKVYVPIKDVEKVTMTDKKRSKFDSWVNGTKVVSSQPTTTKKATSKSKKGILD